MTLRHPVCWVSKGGNTLDQKVYRIGEFAKKASVSIRTLRYYDKEGLLSPTHYSEAGYRLYTDEDLVTLQYILGLKFLGFSLQEIKICLQTGPVRLQEILTQQKTMMMEKRSQLDLIIQALEKTVHLVQTGDCEWDDIVNVIQVLQMEQTNNWVNKYFTPEQQEKMRELSNKAYSETARQRLSERQPWTEEDQKRVDQQYAHLYAELKRLVQAGADPASPEAQAVAKLQCDLIHAFTQGDPEVEAGLRNWWSQYHSLRAEEKPPIYLPSQEEQAFLSEAIRIYKSKQKEV
jgi:DNA-binding transcriptional MerR regulator